MENYINTSLFIHCKKEDFQNGTGDNIYIEESIEAGAVILLKNNSKYVEEGKFISEVINTLPFQKLVLSWNSYTPEGTSIQIEGRVAVRNAQGVESWSKWLSWGTWGNHIKKHSETGENKDVLASVSTDTLIVREKRTAERLQYRLTLRSDSDEKTPIVTLVAGTLENNLQGQEIPFPDEAVRNIKGFSKILDVPSFSQMVRDPKIAGVMCSATSVTMILNYYGVNILPEETAWGLYDYVYEGFGNWPFNMAFASGFGYKAYIANLTIAGLKKEIYQNRPVAVSVKYKNSIDVEAKLPLLEGAPITKTNGHLIVVCGFETEEGIDYAVINDPAAPSDGQVRVRYRLDQFEEAWKASGRIAYIAHPKEKAFPYAMPYIKEEGTLIPVQGVDNEYELWVKGNRIAVDETNIKTIMVSTDNGITYRYIAPGANDAINLRDYRGHKNITFIFIGGEGKIYTSYLKQ